MMLVLSPTYTLRVEIADKMRTPEQIITVDTIKLYPSGAGPNLHRYFDSRLNKTGCDEALAAVKDALAKAGIEHVTVSLEKFEHR